MKQLLLPLYDVLRCLHEEKNIYTHVVEINDEEEGLEDEWLAKMLDQIIDELRISLKESNQRKFSLAITHFGSLIAAIPADLWNTDRLITKIIMETPVIEMKSKTFKSEFIDHILPYLSLIAKRKREKYYILEKKLSPFLRKNGYVCIKQKMIKIYDRNKKHKAVFNQDGSYHIEKTKANLDKKLRLTL